jgi:hypothetical protein
MSSRSTATIQVASALLKQGLAFHALVTKERPGHSAEAIDSFPFGKGEKGQGNWRNGKS